MASSLFGTSSTPIIGTPQAQQFPQTVNDNSILVVEEAIKQSGGDAKTAFYSMAKQKGIDPDNFLKSIQGLGDPKTLMTRMMASNPRVGGLLKLMSMIH